MVGGKGVRRMHTSLVHPTSVAMMKIIDRISSYCMQSPPAPLVSTLYGTMMTMVAWYMYYVLRAHA